MDEIKIDSSARVLGRIIFKAIPQIWREGQYLFLACKQQAVCCLVSESGDRVVFEIKAILSPDGWLDVSQFPQGIAKKYLL